MFRSSGTLIYYPSWWIVLRCCDDLARYYRRSLRIKGLAAPPYGSHITVVNGGVEEPPNKPFWQKYDGDEIEFEYSSEVYGEDGFYWLMVKCDKLHDIREELGLERELKWPLHLTVAKEKC